ncbi:hypothetical protein [Kribbella sp. NPDC051770]|uniref:hypothetical protein n=1 Tax=Kribbella sp. NPDC051770 TaxID=3155413 RepID=UPI0034315D65
MTYVARIVDVPGSGLRLEPAEGSVAPELPNDVNLLGMAAALALGAAGYKHHPEVRDPEMQTLEALLAGEAVMPWRHPESPADAVLVCETGPGGPQCRVEQRPA